MTLFQGWTIRRGGWAGPKSKLLHVLGIQPNSESTYRINSLVAQPEQLYTRSLSQLVGVGVPPAKSVIVIPSLLNKRGY